MNARITVVILAIILFVAVTCTAFIVPQVIVQKDATTRYVGTVSGTIDSTPTKLEETFGGVYGVTFNIRVTSTENNRDRVGTDILAVLGPQWEFLAIGDIVLLHECSLHKKEKMLIGCVVYSYEVNQ